MFQVSIYSFLNGSGAHPNGFGTKQRRDYAKDPTSNCPEC